MTERNRIGPLRLQRCRRPRTPEPAHPRTPSRRPRQPCDAAAHGPSPPQSCTSPEWAAAAVLRTSHPCPPAHSQQHDGRTPHPPPPRTAPQPDELCPPLLWPRWPGLPLLHDGRRTRDATAAAWCCRHMHPPDEQRVPAAPPCLPLPPRRSSPAGKARGRRAELVFPSSGRALPCMMSSSPAFPAITDYTAAFMVSFPFERASPRPSS